MQRGHGVSMQARCSQCAPSRAANMLAAGTPQAGMSRAVTNREPRHRSRKQRHGPVRVAVTVTLAASSRMFPGVASATKLVETTRSCTAATGGGGSSRFRGVCGSVRGTGPCAATTMASSACAAPSRAAKAGTSNHSIAPAPAGIDTCTLGAWWHGTASVRSLG